MEGKIQLDDKEIEKLVQEKWGLGKVKLIELAIAESVFREDMDKSILVFAISSNTD